VLRRLLVTLLFGLVVGGGALLTWHARNQALLVEDDLAAARTLLARAGGFQAGKLGARLDLIDRAEAHAATAEARLLKPRGLDQSPVRPWLRCCAPRSGQRPVRRGWHTTVSCRGLVQRAPQVWQVTLVWLGSTRTTRRPALSALAARIW
jgi:hypothetical protein